MDQKNFGMFFAYLRKKSGFTSQRKLAKAAGINHGTIARIEDGSQKAKPETLKILSHYLVDTSYGELLKKAGYLDELPYSEKEDQLAKNDFMEMTETINESYIRSIMKDDERFIDSVEEEVNKSLKDLIKDKGPITPKNLLNLNRDSPDLNFKVKLNEYLIKIIQSRNIPIKTSFSIDNGECDYAKEMSGNFKPPSGSNEIYRIIDFINDNNNFEVVHNNLLRNREGFAFKVTDNCMNKEGIFEGDTLICVKCPYLSTTDIGIIYDDVDRLLLRKVQTHDSFVILTSSNDDPEVLPNGSIKIIGKAIQVRRNLEIIE